MIFTEEFTIPYYDSSIRGYATAESLLAYMGELATLHSDHVGLDIDNLRENNYGWMLNRWKVKINNYPKARDLIKINTWASNFRKFYANREFNILDKDNNELIKASSIWIFLDMERKRPIRVTDKITSLYDVEDNMLFEEFYDFSQDFTSGERLEFRVRKSDIDYNKHVNNVKYFQWMIEALPESIEDEYVLDEFEILYKKEVGLGSLINTSYCIDEENNQLIILHKIEEQGEIRALGRTIWKKRP